MQSLHDTTIAVLARYAGERGQPIGSETLLSDVGIDRLDISMVALDLEDALHVDIGIDANIEAANSVAELIGCVEAALRAKSHRVSERATAPRIKRSWFETGAGQH